MSEFKINYPVHCEEQHNEYSYSFFPKGSDDALEGEGVRQLAMDASLSPLLIEAIVRICDEADPPSGDGVDTDRLNEAIGEAAKLAGRKWPHG